MTAARSMSASSASHEILRFDYGRTACAPAASRYRCRRASSRCRTIAASNAWSMPPKGQPLAGTLIAISERGLDAAGNILGFLIGPRGGGFTVKRTDEFDVSDCALTPRGDLLLLERRFSWTRGLAIRIRRVPLSRVAPRAVLDGPR